MPHGVVEERMPAPAAEVFAVLHDYSRRLEWDTLLRRADLIDGWERAQRGAVSICQGRWYLGGIAVKTEYVAFEPGEVAAVKLVNRPPFFDTFAASIRHRDHGDGTSQATYTYHFTARPRPLAWLLEPVMARAFQTETRRRLAALAEYLTGSNQ